MYALNYNLIFGETYFDKLIGGVETTLLLFALCLSCALILAVIIAGLRTMRFQPLQIFLVCFVEYQRNVPVLVHLLVWYFGVAAMLPTGIAFYLNRHGAEFIYAAIALSLYGAAFISEDLRSGLRAVPDGQYDGARSIGLNAFQVLRLVIIPQAVRNALPPMINQSLSLFKNTSVAAAIGVAELMYRSREIQTETFRVFEAFSVATLIYFVGSLLIIAAGSVITRRLQVPSGAGAR
jgi:polar amino acid transport system permease protein